MDAPAQAAPLTLAQRLFHLKTLAALAAGLAVGAVGAAAGWQFWLKPQRRVAQMRYDTMQDVSTLFGLQLHYKKVKGVFASDLDTLLTLSPDREEFKAHMADHIDMATIAVVGDADKFKVEANVLDKERTLIKVRGPVADAKPAAPVLPAAHGSAAGLDDVGAPIQPAP